MNTAYILLGTNLGDKTANIKTACQKISSGCGTILQHSSLYETSPWGVTEQASFLNCALCLNTPYAPEILLQRLLDIEKEMGRIRIQQWGERLIDLDLLYFNREIIRTEQLTLPHPELQNRNFVLVPLCEIAPDYLHPVLGRSNQELLDNCPDEGTVTKISSTFL